MPGQTNAPCARGNASIYVELQNPDDYLTSTVNPHSSVRMRCLLIWNVFKAMTPFTYFPEGKSHLTKRYVSGDDELVNARGIRAAEVDLMPKGPTDPDPSD